MERQNINFKLLSLNARGIRSFDKRKSIFNWLFKSSADICFLQETYSTPEVENEWKKQWKVTRKSLTKLSGTTEFLCYDKKSMYRRDIVNLGFVKIKDLISAHNSFLCDFSSLTNPEQRFFLMSIINSIPAEWRSLIKASTNVISANPIPITPTIKLPSGNVVPILDISPKQIYQIFLQQKQIAPTAKQKLSNNYANIDIDWEKAYTLAFHCTLDTKIREFHYKILNCIIFTNVKLNLIGVVESPNCTFCQEAAESVEHLLFSCRISSEFWKHVLSWLRDNYVHVETINESDVIFGKFDIVEDYILINHILLLAKYYLCRERLSYTNYIDNRLKYL